MTIFKEIITVSLILFAVIDILGSIPVLVDIKTKVGNIHHAKATYTAGFIMLLFLVLGESLLGLIGIDTASFAVAGSIVIFFIALEMILGITLFKSDGNNASNASIVPIAFPLIAGAGTLTTILSLKAEYHYWVIGVAILLNLLLVYFVLKFVPYLEKKLGQGGIDVLRRIFGIILLAIAIKLFKTNLLM